MSKRIHPKIKAFKYDELDAMNEFLAGDIDLLGNGVVYKDDLMICLWDDRRPDEVGMSKEDQVAMVKEELKKVCHNRIAGELELRLWQVREKKKLGGKEKQKLTMENVAIATKNCTLLDEQIKLYKGMLSDIETDKFSV